MGVYIKGMEKPGRCDECPLQDYYECDAKLRDTYCPLVPVPPHGRLGDLGKLEQMFADIDHAPYSGFDGLEPFYSAENAAQIIRLAPTIIPAEPGEEEAT